MAFIVMTFATHGGAELPASETVEVFGIGVVSVLAAVIGAACAWRRCEAACQRRQRILADIASRPGHAEQR